MGGVANSSRSYAVFYIFCFVDAELNLKTLHICICWNINNLKAIQSKQVFSAAIVILITHIIYDINIFLPYLRECQKSGQFNI